MEMVLGLVETYKIPLMIVGGASLFLFVATPIIIPLVVRGMHYDYFIRGSSKSITRSPLRFVLYMVWHVFKNILGVIFVLTGVILLFVPGQGILTILAGIVLLDFPGKLKLITRLTRGDKIRRALNWIRRKTNRREFVFDGHNDDQSNSIEHN